MNWNVGVFERLCNTLLLALSFILFLYLLNVNQMEKREWCATYIAAGQCRCSNTDASQLLNESVDIKLPPTDGFSAQQMIDNTFYKEINISRP